MGTRQRAQHGATAYSPEIGDTGKFYCGRKVLRCRCCDGHCGPNNGCNCKACQKLDLVKQERLEEDAALIKQLIIDANVQYGVVTVFSGETGKFYCGRKVLSCRCCNGHCGPTNGCNCQACQKLDLERVKGLNELSRVRPRGVFIEPERAEHGATKYSPKIGETGKFYCGRKVMLCRCCDGHCGPNNGCNCTSCQKLDLVKQYKSSEETALIKQLIIEANVQYGVVAVFSGETGKFYCGRKVLNCRCCDGHCGPNNGCNCKDCQKLDLERERGMNKMSTEKRKKELSTGESSRNNESSNCNEGDMSCVICLDKERDTMCIPCQHVVACTGCAERIQDCPICRKTIVHRLLVVKTAGNWQVRQAYD